MTGKHTHFPMFIESAGKKVLIIGGGAVAERRVLTLKEFGFEITVISEDLTETLRSLSEEGVFRYQKGKCAAGAEIEKISGGPADLLLACTDDREVNRWIGAYGRKKNIPVNVCDAREESTFWFPAIALNEELTMGLVGDGTSHGTVRKAAAALREVIEERSYEK